MQVEGVNPLCQKVSLLWVEKIKNSYVKKERPLLSGFSFLNTKLVYKDIPFEASADTAANGRSFIYVNNVGGGAQGFTGYNPVALTVKDGNQVGNGMIYHPHLSGTTSCYIWVENMNGNNAYRGSGTLRVLYIK